MTTNINADDGVVSGVAGLKTSADNSGVLALQTNGTTALTVNASQALGVGSTPSYGTSGQVLTSAGSGASPTWTTIGSGSSQWTTNGTSIYYNTGNVGIGTTTPAKPLNVVNSATSEIWVESTSTQKAILSVYASDISVGITSTYNSGGSAARPFIFYNVSTPLLQFDVGKSVALQGASTQTGTGITFPATQSASSDANTLDDYEEGSWTPVFTFGGASVGVTYNNQFGYYTKIGNRVFISCYIGLANKGSSTGNISITGLPFTSANTLFNSVCVWGNNLSSITGGLQGYTAPNTSTISEIAYLGTGTQTPLTNSNINNNSAFLVTLNYSV